VQRDKKKTKEKEIDEEDEESELKNDGKTEKESKEEKLENLDEECCTLPKAKQEETTEFLNGLKLASFDYLNSLKRSVCPTCNRRRRYFCYTCFQRMGPSPELIPTVQLPIFLDILHHPQELKSKSTAIHAKVLSPDWTSIHEYPQIPDYNAEETVLLYPNKDAKAMEDLDLTKVKRVVVIDSTWNQTRFFLRDDKVQKLPCVKLQGKKTYFWRYQRECDTCLSTIEAIYYFYVEYRAKMNGSYDGIYDNLLYFYIYLYQLIQRYYKEREGERVFHRIDNYIKYD